MKCSECPKYKNCTSLCEAAELYVNKDYCRQKEITLTDIGLDINSVEDLPIETVSLLTTKDWLLLLKSASTPLTKKQKRNLYLHFWRGLTFAEIGRKYNITRMAVYDSVKKAKKKVKL